MIKNRVSNISKTKMKKKYTIRDQQEDLERLELLLIGLETPMQYKKIYTKIIKEDDINNDIKDDINDDINDEINYYYEINKDNLIWLNHNLSILNKRNIKLIETLKLIQKILKRISI